MSNLNRKIGVNKKKKTILFKIKYLTGFYPLFISPKDYLLKSWFTVSFFFLFFFFLDSNLNFRCVPVCRPYWRGQTAAESAWSGLAPNIQKLYRPRQHKLSNQTVIKYMHEKKILPQIFCHVSWRSDWPPGLITAFHSLTKPVYIGGSYVNTEHCFWLSCFCRDRGSSSGLLSALPDSCGTWQAVLFPACGCDESQSCRGCSSPRTLQSWNKKNAR